MAFPVVAATETSGTDPSSFTHVVSLPAGIQAGDLLLVGIGHPWQERRLTWPAGWTVLKTLDATDNAIEVAYRKADGTEGSTISVTSLDDARTAHFAYRITGGADPDIQAPEVSAGAVGEDTTPNPDSLTPTGGAADYLWIATAGGDNASTSGYPTNYDDAQVTHHAGGTGGAAGNVAAASRGLNAVSEDPGAFTLDASDSWTALTVAVHPASAVDPQVFFDVTDLPSDFGNAETAEIVVRTRGVDIGATPLKLYAQLFQSDEATALSDEVEVASHSSDSSFANTTTTFTGLNTTANKSVWDNARIRFRWGT